jgi:hypothetical protein
VALEWVPGLGLQLPFVPGSLPGVGSNPGQQLLLDFLAAFLAVFLADFFAADFFAVVMIVGGCSWVERCFGISVELQEMKTKGHFVVMCAFVGCFGVSGETATTANTEGLSLRSG